MEGATPRTTIKRLTRSSSAHEPAEVEQTPRTLIRNIVKSIPAKPVEELSTPQLIRSTAKRLRDTPYDKAPIVFPPPLPLSSSLHAPVERQTKGAHGKEERQADTAEVAPTPRTAIRLTTGVSKRSSPNKRLKASPSSTSENRNARRSSSLQEEELKTDQLLSTPSIMPYEGDYMQASPSPNSTSTRNFGITETINNALNNTLMNRDIAEEYMEPFDVYKSGISTDLPFELPSKPTQKRKPGKKNNIKQTNNRPGKWIGGNNNSGTRHEWAGNPVSKKKDSEDKDSSHVEGSQNNMSTGNNIPTALSLTLFKSHSTMPIHDSATNSIINAGDEFIQQLSEDLSIFAKHAKRSRIQFEDIELLAKRQGFVSSHPHIKKQKSKKTKTNKDKGENQTKQDSNNANYYCSINDLARDILPLEIVEKINKIARAGNVVMPT